MLLLGGQLREGLGGPSLMDRVGGVHVELLGAVLRGQERSGVLAARPGGAADASWPACSSVRERWSMSEGSAARAREGV